MKLPLFIGKALYIITKPGIHRMLKGSTRVYVLFRVGDEVLVSKNWLGLHKTWRLPGGGMQKDETPTQALAREVKEELGVDIEENKLQPLQYEPYFEHQKKFTYWLYVLPYEAKPELHINEKEIVAAEWMHIAKLATAPLSEELKIAIRHMN